MLLPLLLGHDQTRSANAGSDAKRGVVSVGVGMRGCGGSRNTTSEIERAGLTCVQISGTISAYTSLGVSYREIRI